MSIEQLFKGCFSALNGGSIRKTALDTALRSCLQKELVSSNIAGKEFMAIELTGKKAETFFMERVAQRDVQDFPRCGISP